MYIFLKNNIGVIGVCLGLLSASLILIVIESGTGCVVDSPSLLCLLTLPGLLLSLLVGTILPTIDTSVGKEFYFFHFLFYSLFFACLGLVIEKLFLKKKNTYETNDKSNS